MAIDWYEVASQLGGIEADGSERVMGTDGGRRALELLLGEENIRDAVDHWADQKPGEFTAEAVLLIIGSTVAMERCYEIYKAEPASHRAGAAVFLLAEMADSRALPWVREFLEDSSEGIRWNGLMALRRILEGALGDAGIASAKELLSNAEADASERLRDRAREVRHQLASDPSLSHLEL
jgi:HEAT repeat protein